MFNFNNNCFDHYSSYINSHFNNEQVENGLKQERKEGAFALRVNDKNEIILSFIDKKDQFKSICLKRELNKIKADTGLGSEETYNNINEILDNYKLNHFFKQKQYFLDLVDTLKNKAREDPLHIPQNIQNYGINTKTLEGQRALIEIAKIAASQNGEGTSQYIKITALTQQQ